MDVVRNAKGGGKAESKSSSDDNGRSRGASNVSSSSSSNTDIWGKGITGGSAKHSGNGIAQEEDRMRLELAAVAEIKPEAKASEVKEGNPNSAVRRAMLVRMKSLTMADEDTCSEFLESSDYNLEGAVQEYYNKM